MEQFDITRASIGFYGSLLQDAYAKAQDALPPADRPREIYFHREVDEMFDEAVSIGHDIAVFMEDLTSGPTLTILAKWQLTRLSERFRFVIVIAAPFGPYDGGIDYFELPPNVGLVSESRQLPDILGAAKSLISRDAFYRNRQIASSLQLDFEFPSALAPICQQYLAYFGKFLADLGIDATTEMTHHASQVLFTITPADHEQALSAIREALGIYLRLPSSAFDTTGSTMIDVMEAKQLSANVEHFRGQLAIEVSKGEMKDVLLMAQREIINDQKDIILSQRNEIQSQANLIDQHQVTGNIMIQSLKSVTPSPTAKTEENLFGDIVQAKSWDWMFLRFNLPNAIRKLKDKIADRRSP